MSGTERYTPVTANGAATAVTTASNTRCTLDTLTLSDLETDNASRLGADARKTKGK